MCKHGIIMTYLTITVVYDVNDIASQMLVIHLVFVVRDTCAIYDQL